MNTVRASNQMMMGGGIGGIGGIGGVGVRLVALALLAALEDSEDSAPDLAGSVWDIAKAASLNGGR